MSAQVSAPLSPGERSVRERGWTLRRRIGSSFAVLAVIFIVLSAVVATSAILFGRAGNRVIYRWQPAVALSDRVLTGLLSQETSVRGYALTGDASYLVPYRSYSLQRPVDQRRLRELVAGDDMLQRRLDALVRAADRWTAEIADPAVAAIARQEQAGKDLAASLTGKVRFDEIRVASDRLSGALRARTADERQTRTVAGTFFGVSGVLMVLIIIACGLVLRRGLDRWVLRPMLRLGGQTREVAGGDTHRQIAPDGPVELTDLGRDVEAMRRQIAHELANAERIQDELRVRGEELARSNEDLQQFAYVASHDLSEPLRKVANFCQLLERQYGPQLDDRARQYIAFAVDGAKRMQALITDLLTLSRVGRNSDGFERMDLDAKLDQALANLADRMAAAGATVERLTPLPTVDGDRSLLVSLLENLVGNAVKYRRDDVAPVVRVGAQLDTEHRCWEITVSDNGIGIDAKYAERIFAVFQRLHLRDAYGGTGIGLALCRKIVEFHGGRIWLVVPDSDVESPEQSDVAGATFRFTLPEGDRRAQSRD